MGSAGKVLGTTLENPVGSDHRPDLRASRQEIAEYLDRQGAYDLFDYLLRELLVKQPVDPLAHMARCLETEHPLGPLKVIFHSPPNVGRAGYAKRLAEHWGLEYISAGQLLLENGVDISGDLAPDTVVSELVMERVRKAEDSMQGWVLDGFPRTNVQTSYLKEQSVVPSHVFCLQATGDWIRKRHDAEVDEGGLDRLERRLNTYSCHSNALQIYEDKSRAIDAEQGEEAVWQELERTVRLMPHSKSPLRPPPRVAIFGPRGAGAREHASALAARLGAVFVDGEQASAHGAGAPEARRDRLGALGVRLRQKDCLAHGWVACGLPVDGAAAELLRGDPQLSPTRVAVLDASAETCVRQLRDQLLDAVTGKVWTSSPANEKIKGRLRRQPQNEADAVEAAHAEFTRQLPAVLQAFSVDGSASKQESSCQQIPADGPPLDVFHALADFVERPLSLRPRQQ